MMLWAHGVHIIREPTAMGGYLGSWYGSDYVTVGMTFTQDNFNAVSSGGSTTAGAHPVNASIDPNNSIEAVFAATGKNLALFNTRQISAGGGAAQPLSDIEMRFVGADFVPANETSYFLSIQLPDAFDLLLFSSVSTPTQLLPF